MTLLEEPSLVAENALDPLSWFVYADWLEDQGRGEESTRARCIGRGLERTGGDLWLVFITERQRHVQSTFHAHEIRDRNCPDPSYTYVWLPGRVPDWEWREDVSRNPVTSPEFFETRPDLVRAYWDKLEELGK